ncbi:low molecular weight phosphotyrosine protein phosphatase [Paraburkholderia sp. D15]|uniref:arsenate reductase/protein-tyrosine-phosphatase family protein n=1 Tax=Paraburkholderia sp. D15 TaxID=2880218 RepID=UPI00247AF1A0|nr:low molecular weight phosphotyrosine protein phosphatase [Paraburkholderia sp. D15]WGS53981.1 low molecular weight phosphotyrosine protein phosphatase [Paraburkholderia sp. D15]WKF60485.1 Low molecular weight protein-tyrosine-phosphatase Ptp [Paraburkholderia busanensis]
MTDVLMVCEGNLCRSPMAAALLAAALPRVAVHSAGTRALVGRRAPALAVELMDGRGIDLRPHVSSVLTPAQVRGARLILAMTRAQCALIEHAFPFARGRVYRLGEHERLDIVDPYRRGRFTFELAIAQIEQGVQRWLDAIAAVVR